MRPPTASRGATCHQSRIGYGKPWAPSRSTRSSRSWARRGSTSCEKPTSNETRSLETPSSRQASRTRPSSAASGVTATCREPAAANTIVLAPDPVSSVAISDRTSASSHSSAGHARPQYSSPAPWIPGGAARSRSVSVATSNGSVGGVVRSCGLLPREPSGSRDALRAPLGRSGQDLLDRRDDLLDGRRVEEARRVAAHLRQRGGVRARDRAPACHRLERRLSEAFVEAREHEPRGGPGQADELVTRNVAQRADAVRCRAVVGGEDELELGMSLAQLGERGEEPLVILVRPRAGRIDEEAPALDLGLRGRERVVIETEVDRPHP